MTREARTRRLKAATTLRFNAYSIISEAVSRGVQCGMTRAYKYSDEPSSDHIAEAVELAVMGQLSEVLDWGTE